MTPNAAVGQKPRASLVTPAKPETMALIRCKGTVRLSWARGGHWWPRHVERMPDGDDSSVAHRQLKTELHKGGGERR
ncbi:hypothetical protein V6N13_107689 [Hibiscus sabdariffa]